MMIVFVPDFGNNLRDGFRVHVSVLFQTARPDDEFMALLFRQPNTLALSSCRLMRIIYRLDLPLQALIHSAAMLTSSLGDFTRALSDCVS
jgi:hypothetical protein